MEGAPDSKGWWILALTLVGFVVATIIVEWRKTTILRKALREGYAELATDKDRLLPVRPKKRRVES